MQGWKEIPKFFTQNETDALQRYYAVAEKMAFFSELA